MRNILVIMNLFAPHNNSGAIPNSKLIKYLARENVKITLVTQEIMPGMVVDNSLLPEEMCKIRTIRVGHSGLYTKTMEAGRNRITDNGVKLKMKAETRRFRSYIVNVLKNAYLGSRDWDWYLQARRKIRKELAQTHFDCVYSTYPNQVNHWLANYVMKHAMADKWIADFRDPMFYEYHDAHNRSRMKSQHRIEREADTVTIVSCSYREGLGLNVIEGMLCCKPVVASVNRGHTELVEDGVTGYLVQPGDAQAFADRICKVYSGSEMARNMGLSGAKKAEGYTVAEVKKTLMTIIGEVYS